MSSFGTTTHRPSSNSPSSPSTPRADDSKNRSQKDLFSFTFWNPFNLPSSPESAAIRIVRNLEKFSLYYAVFVWTVLFIALIPERKVSVVYLVATTEVGFLYYLLLRACPDSAILHRIIDKRFVFFILFMIACVFMIVTRAFEHLFIVLSATVPVVLIHSVLSKSEDVCTEEDGEMARLVQEKLGDVAPEKPRGDVPAENMV